MQYILADKYRFMRWLLLASRQLEDTYDEELFALHQIKTLVLFFLERYSVSVI